MNTYLKQAAMLVCVLVLSASAAGADPVTTVTLRARLATPSRTCR